MTDSYPSTRAEAKKLGEKWYYTGKSCSKGHYSPRLVSNCYCRECGYQKNRDWYAANLEEQRKRGRDLQKRLRKEDPERLNQRQRDRRMANRERELSLLREQSRRWRENNRDRSRMIVKSASHRRRAVTRQGMSSSDQRDWEDRQEKVCFYCDADVSQGYEVDHILPLSKGGAHEASNLVIACRTCNAKKSNRDPDEFLDGFLAGFI